MNKYLLLMVMCLVLSGCANRQQSRQVNEEKIGQILANTDRCTAQRATNNKASCYLGMYEQVQVAFQDTDPEKAPVLNAVRKLYVLATKKDSNLIDQRQAQNELMKVSSELQQELNEARYRAANVNASEAQRKRILFLEAQRLLSLPQSNVKTCTPQAGGPSGAMVCN